MKKPPLSFVPLLGFCILVPCSQAAAPAADHPPGWLGILLSDGDASTRGPGATPSSPQVEGALVGGVVEGGPADEGRLRAKDTIVAVDGVPVTGNADLMARIQGLEPGSFVTLSVKRRGHDLELKTVLGTRPDKARRGRMVRGWLGVEAIELPASLRAHFGAPETAGVLVSRVTEGSPAENSGIRVGDVIYEADGQAVTSAEALSEFVSTAGVENTIDVALARDGARIVVAPRIERAP